MTYLTFSLYFRQMFAPLMESLHVMFVVGHLSGDRATAVIGVTILGNIVHIVLIATKDS